MEKPIGKAIVLCDQVIEDKRSGNKSLINIFNSICCKKFPAAHARLAVYVALCNGAGKMMVKLLLRRADGEKVKTLMTAEGQVEFKNPNQVIELIFDLRGLLFVGPGLHTFEVIANSEYIFETKFNVSEAK